MSQEMNSPAQRLEDIAKSTLSLVRTAKRNSKSLAGQNHYAHKLVELRAEATNTFRELQSGSAGDASAMAELLDAVFDPGTDSRQRARAVNDLIYSLRTTWHEANAAKPAAVQEVVPLELVAATKRSYLVSILRAKQVNGCRYGGWFDASLVMLRRLVEVVIIEAFEHHGIDHKIKGHDGSYLFLRDLVGRALAETKWNLSRNTKKYLPDLKELGDQSAHGRYFHATEGDMEKVGHGARVVAEEFLRLAGLL